MPPGLVIFDCDGVLVDSEPISIALLIELIVEAGGMMTEDVAYERFLGRSMASISDTLSQEFGLDVRDEHLANMRAGLYQRFRRELQPIAGVRRVLEALRIPRCVASSSQLERIRLSLSVTGLLELLDPHIYSASMVKRGKPAPDLFLHASREMAVAPADCVVVEDSPAGIAAARRAGMRVFGFVGGAHARSMDLAGALAELGPDAIFDDMRQLPGLLAGPETARKTS